MSFNNNKQQMSNKQIIKLTPQQVLRQIFSNTQMNNQHQQPQQAPLMNPSLNLTPRGQEKTCGLFDTDLILKNMPMDLDMENMQILNDNKEYSNEFEEYKPLTDFLITNFGNELFDLNDMPVDDDMPILVTDENIKPKSKFAKKLEDANLRISLPTNNMTQKPQAKMADLNNAIAINDELNSIITPGIEKTFTQLLQSIPTGELLNTVHDDFNLFDFNSATTRTDDILDESKQETLTSVVPIDHAYVKPKLLEINDELTNDSFVSSLNDTEEISALPVSSDSLSAKKKRPRGVYRKDDIRNEEDLENYLQRRRKNNLSSKVSRANKKAAYQELDSKIEFLFSSNKKLTSKITKLENINKIIKDMLVDKLAKSSAT